MTASKLAGPVYRCGVHDYGGTLSWFQLIGVCRCITVVCRTEPDGWHVHQLRVGDESWSRIVLVEDRHDWMDGGRAVTVQRGTRNQVKVADLAAGWALAGSWETLGLPAAPAVPCQRESAVATT